MPGDRRSRCHFRIHQMGASALPLPPFEITIGSRGTALTRFQLVVVHRETHRTTRLAPLKSRRDKNLVQPFLFGLPFYQSGTGHHHRQLHIRRDMLAARNRCRSTQIFNARIGAGADEHLVYVDLHNRRVWLQPHIFQCALGSIALDWIAEARRVGHAPVHRHHHFR